MKPHSSSEPDQQDQEIIRLLKKLRAFEAAYPTQLLSARRSAFLTQVEHLGTVDGREELSAADQEIVNLLGTVKSAQPDYPPDLLAARRSAFIRQVKSAGATSLLDRFRLSIQKTFQYQTTTSTWPTAGFMRASLVIGSIIALVLLGSLFLTRTQQSSNPSASQVAVEPTLILPTSTSEIAIVLCEPGDQTPLCLPGALDPGQDLADQRNGAARPAVSKDARPGDSGVYRASYVNDGRPGQSWVSNSPNSWLKIDLGKVTMINTISLQKGMPESSGDNDPGQFVIAVALSDAYADGDSRNDHMEYAQVFDSEQTGIHSTASSAETIRIQFQPVQARFVKLTFEQAGTAIEEVGVFMVRPPVLAEQPTSGPSDDQPGATLTPMPTNVLSVMGTATSMPTDTWLATDTASPIPTDTPTAAASETPFAAETPTLQLTSTLPPTDTSTPLAAAPLPSETPIPLPTIVPPTAIPPTAIPPVIQPSPVNTGPIVVTGNGKTLTFTCNGDDAEIRGHSNTITLLGSCSSITVTGNGNRVFWQSGSPVIINRGRDNIISQL